MVVTYPAFDEPQTSVTEVNTEVLTKSAKIRLRRETGDINRGLNESNNKTVIDPSERERNLIIKENYKSYGELENYVRRKVLVVSFRVNSESLDVVDYDFESGRKYKMPTSKNNNKYDDIVVY
jgi:hypothetical protein